MCRTANVIRVEYEFSCESITFHTVEIMRMLFFMLKVVGKIAINYSLITVHIFFRVHISCWVWNGSGCMNCPLHENTDDFEIFANPRFFSVILASILKSEISNISFLGLVSSIKTFVIFIWKNASGNMLSVLLFFVIQLLFPHVVSSHGLLCNFQSYWCALPLMKVCTSISGTIYTQNIIFLPVTKLH